jgi:hypothetical protein
MGGIPEIKGAQDWIQLEYKGDWFFVLLASRS